jgi:heptosyltransferase-3
VKPVQSILFITLSNIGDAILTTPTLEALHQRYPDAMIDIVGDARSDIIFKHCPYVGTVFLKHKREGWRGLIQLVRALRKKRYDLAVDLRTDGLLWLLRARRRLTKLNNQDHLSLHSAEKHFRAIAPLVSGTPLPTQIWLSPTEETEAQRMLADYAGQRILAVGPGANWAPKTWPAEYFAALINLLQNRFDAVVLLGNAQNQPLAAIVEAQVKLPVINLCGKTDLLLVAALLKRCAAFIGNDSGLGHLASAVNIPTLTIFGPGEPWRYRPWSPQSVWLQSESGIIADITPEQARDTLLPILDRNCLPTHATEI